MNSSHNQSNSATRGGQGSVPTPANSGGSGIFGSMSVGATHGNQPQGAGATGPNAGNRRPSQEQSGLFGGLSNLKRNSLDQQGQVRRSSMTEQRPEPGMLGKMWNNFTQGKDQK